MDTDRIVKLLNRIGWPEWELRGHAQKLQYEALADDFITGWCIGTPRYAPEIAEHVALALIEKHLREWLAARDFFVNGFADYLAVLLEAVEDVLAEE